MKKFEFSLGKLLSYKRQLLKKEKDELARLRVEQQRAIDEGERLKLLVIDANKDFILQSEKGMMPQQIILAKGYINSMTERVRILIKTIAIMETNIDKQLKIVVEATKEVSSIEKLEEKQFEEYKIMVQKSEELFIEEFVSNAAARVGAN